MQYKCTLTIKGKGFLGGLIPKYFKGEVITEEEYKKLSTVDKCYFIEDYTDEDFGEQLSRNIVKDESND